MNISVDIMVFTISIIVLTMIIIVATMINIIFAGIGFLLNDERRGTDRAYREDVLST